MKRKDVVRKKKEKKDVVGTVFQSGPLRLQAEEDRMVEILC